MADGNPNLFYDAPLGAFPSHAGTIFRVFAPNALSLRILHGKTPELGRTLEADEVDDGLWEVGCEENLDHHFYAISVEPKFCHDLPANSFFRILDPYALACFDGQGTAIALDRASLPQISIPHTPPPMADCVILEGHLRDLLGLSQNRSCRPSYPAFNRWLRARDNYPLCLGINVLELQPLQEFDSIADVDYHWGYMPVNFFSPTRVYATDKRNGSQVWEFFDLVRECHGHGLSLVLDVVYNHVGNPNALLMLGGNYFFRLQKDGTFSNCSGCGNDLRTEAPMCRRLILDSLIYLLQTFDIDGFRFDLAELIDEATLRAIELTLREKKPNCLIIAEPWSFRGHGALALKETSWSYWNDDFRESVRHYVLGNSNREALQYFQAGCTSHLTRMPSQSINYTASHDDRTWIDQISSNGLFPLPEDLRRTRLMLAILFTCLGVPMLAQGQDFLHSKGGLGNTYRDAAVNLLDPERLEQFSAMHRYATNWIRLRRSPRGAPLRHRLPPEVDFFSHYPGDGSPSSLGTLYNANQRQGNVRLLFLINPDPGPTFFFLHNISNLEQFRLIADAIQFYGPETVRPLAIDHPLGPLACELWYDGPEDLPCQPLSPA
ncbi:MAG: hypothetical protein LBP65_00345 [Puniceicoccales bacterium]|jgi:pullulanase/glycogen debranching enzyme|nr:hypothetical protein [Puniceicoccales bacterium]